MSSRKHKHGRPLRVIVIAIICFAAINSLIKNFDFSSIPLPSPNGSSLSSDFEDLIDGFKEKFNDFFSSIDKFRGGDDDNGGSTGDDDDDDNNGGSTGDDDDDNGGGNVNNTPQFTYYSYSCMNDDQKKAYDIMYKALTDNETTVSFEYPESFGAYDEIIEIAESVLADHPEIFWITGQYNVQQSVSLTGFGDYTVTFKPFDYWKYSNDREKYINELDEKVTEIAGMAKKYDSKFDQVKFVHDYLCKNIEYDYDVLELPTDDFYSEKCRFSHSAYGALVKNKCVCSGYSKGFQIVMNRLGYDCAYIIGYAGGGHAWNLLKIDGEYYWMDLTWDEYGEDLKDAVRHSYFGIPSNIMLKTHLPESFPPVPECTATKYEYCSHYESDFSEFNLDDVIKAVGNQSDEHVITVRSSSANILDKIASNYYKIIESPELKNNKYFRGNSHLATRNDKDSYTYEIILE